MSTLNLSLHKLPFEVMLTGEKDNEFRVPSKWIVSRLYNKDGSLKKYDVVKFVNGYGYDKPYFICQYLGFEICTRQFTEVYSNGFEVEVCDGDYIIKLGKILHTGNIK